MLGNYIKSKNLSVYSVAKGSGIPYTTLNEIVLGKKVIEDCSYKTINKIAKYFNMTTDDAVKEFSTEVARPTLSASWEECKDKIYIFPQVINSDVKNIRRIHPLKQSLITNIFEATKDLTDIKSLIVFGSSINIRCNKDSDIDIAVELDKRKNAAEIKNFISEKIQSACNFDADIIWMDRIQPGTNIYKNIMKGVKLI